MTGRKLHCLTFIKVSAEQSAIKGSRVWELLCDCGNTTYSILGAVRCGDKKHCGCMIPDPLRWTEQKFFMLTFIAPTDKIGIYGAIWEARCDCGNLTTCAPNIARIGHKKSCGCWINYQSSSEGGKLSRKYEPIISSARTVWKWYKDIQIDFDDFYRLSQEDCFYCGRLPFKTFNIADKKPTKSRPGKASEHAKTNGTFTYNGLDCIDNTLGHVLGNLVPCCWQCNRMKGSKTLEEFGTHIMLMGRFLLLPKIPYRLDSEWVGLTKKELQSAKSVWQHGYRDSDFNLFYALSQERCYYCGCEPHKVSARAKHFTYNGIDRLDSSLSHIEDNMVPCCWTCNRIKNDTHADEFIPHVLLICSHLKLL